SQGIAPLPQLNQALRSDAMPGSRGCDHQAPSQIVSRNMKAQMRRMNVGIGNAFSTVHAASLRSKKGAKAPDGIETGSNAQDQTIYAATVSGNARLGIACLLRAEELEPGSNAGPVQRSFIAMGRAGRRGGEHMVRLMQHSLAHKAAAIPHARK